MITIQKCACEIYDPSRGAIVVVQMSSNRLFPLKIRTSQPFLMAKVKDPSWLALAFLLWSLEFCWIKDSTTKGYGDRPFSNYHSFSSLRRMCC